ncbi:unnamed protein product [Phytophthora lilii]|uniref:Unnamed protein product n=1 Tax=Phytophthora lilii TaxID=2077276 RepID=A0A9W6WYP7_9STRA|nr:unnamed protein product [Phytophthora lilii]
MKVKKAKKANRGVRLMITPHEIAYPMTPLSGGGMHGGSFWSKIWSGIKTGAKFLKDSGLLSKVGDALVVPASA